MRIILLAIVILVGHPFLFSQENGLGLHVGISANDLRHENKLDLQRSGKGFYFDVFAEKYLNFFMTAEMDLGFHSGKIPSLVDTNGLAMYRNTSAFHLAGSIKVWWINIFNYARCKDRTRVYYSRFKLYSNTGVGSALFLQKNHELLGSTHPIRATQNYWKLGAGFTFFNLFNDEINKGKLARPSEVKKTLFFFDVNYLMGMKSFYKESGSPRYGGVLFTLGAKFGQLQPKRGRSGKY